MPYQKSKTCSSSNKITQNTNTLLLPSLMTSIQLVFVLRSFLVLRKSAALAGLQQLYFSKKTVGVRKCPAFASTLRSPTVVHLVFLVFL